MGPPTQWRRRLSTSARSVGPPVRQEAQVNSDSGRVARAGARSQLALSTVGGAPPKNGAHVGFAPTLSQNCSNARTRLAERAEGLSGSWGQVQIVEVPVGYPETKNPARQAVSSPSFCGSPVPTLESGSLPSAHAG